MAAFQVFAAVECEDGSSVETVLQLEGPSVVLRWLLSLRATCKEMNALVLTQYLPLLATHVGPAYWKELDLPTELVDGTLTTLMEDPRSLKLPALKVRI